MSKKIRQSLVAGNWKLNGIAALVTDFNEKLKTVQCDANIVVCSPSTLFHHFSGDAFSLGAQNVSYLDNGALTGELSLEVIKAAGCSYAPVGHSERREDKQASNDLVASKAK